MTIDKGKITVDYGDPQYLYSGKEVASGHYKLNQVNGSGEATLHQTPGSDTLEGSWKEDWVTGYWSIKLG